MEKEQVRVISASNAGVAACAAAARISTTSGGAETLFQQSTGGAKDVQLVGKVLRSGHQSVLEHHTFTLAFDGVSVLAEAYMIESRLASFTVKSRRYVDFSQAGFVTPSDIPAGQEAEYEADMRAGFEAYEALLALGIPREDARFVLPYSFRSHFYMTLNARELVHLIGGLLYGRGRVYPELFAIGMSLKDQLDAIYPDVVEKEAARYTTYHQEAFPSTIATPRLANASVAWMSGPASAEAILKSAVAFDGRYEGPSALADLLNDPRPRPLEHLNYTFGLSHVSLAGVTHFVRHRMQSIQVASIASALGEGAFVMPDRIRDMPDARRLYEAAFARQADAARRMKEAGAPWSLLSYYALSGMEVDLLLTMNARELLHFLQLRMCTRAQWEIRALANAMQAKLNEAYPALFSMYGPSCALTGHCPEGRLSCGHPWKPTAGSHS